MIAHPLVYIFFTLGISGTLGYRISIGENENLLTTLLRHAYLNSESSLRTNCQCHS